MAVRLVILFLEGTFVKLLEAECTHKVLWVKFTVHSSDTTACDRLLTAVAQCTSPGMIVHLTVWSAIMLKEASSWKSLMTFLKRKLKIGFLLTISIYILCKQATRKEKLVNIGYHLSVKQNKKIYSTQ